MVYIKFQDPVFDIREFMPSQSYYFHETWQLGYLDLSLYFLDDFLYFNRQHFNKSIVKLFNMHVRICTCNFQ